MESVAVKNTLSVPVLPDKNLNAEDVAPSVAPSVAREIDPDSVLFQLGAWVAGLESYLSVGGQSFIGRGVPEAGQNYIKELRIARAALQRCSHMCFLLLDSAARNNSELLVSAKELTTLATTIREPLMLSDGLIRAEHVTAGEWRAWSNVVLDKLTPSATFAKLVANSEAGGGNFLPEKLKHLIGEAPASSRARKELDVILPRFGRILRMLDIVGEMLERDEPLKPALLIFSKVTEQTQELVSFLNQRVARAGDDSDEFLGVLDGASYTASIELKKVVQQELSGLTAMRAATSIYARNETAYALLTESFQQILAQFARQVDPSVNILDLFPNFQHKQDQSIILRNDLYRITQLVQTAEREPKAGNFEKLNAALTSFMEKSVRFLFYKDVETVERFVEEILITKQKTDLVPIVHRFGAYLETLFAQVNMRAVLEAHPFDPKSI